MSRGIKYYLTYHREVGIILAIKYLLETKRRFRKTRTTLILPHPFDKLFAEQKPGREDRTMTFEITYGSWSDDGIPAVVRERTVTVCVDNVKDAFDESLRQKHDDEWLIKLEALED